MLFAWGFFCVSLLPVMGLTDVYFMKYSLVADHYQYAALIGVIALDWPRVGLLGKNKRIRLDSLGRQLPSGVIVTVALGIFNLAAKQVIQRRHDFVPGNTGKKSQLLDGS